MNKTAFIFPGQGSQYAGMGKDIFLNFKAAREVFEEADDALGIMLSTICFDGSEDELKLTANTQPAILATSIAVLRVIQEETGRKADFLAGHSLGEYSALVSSGALRFSDAVRIVRARGTFMQEAVPVGTGAMAAILGVDPETLENICSEVAQDEVVSPANFNSPGQIVIAGHASAVNRAIEAAKMRGFRKAMLLPVSAPFHCGLMKPAADRLAAIIEKNEFMDMNFPVISNVTAKPNSDARRAASLLVEQVCAPVLWEQSVNEMISLGVEDFIEIGPGKVLGGLVKRISKDVNIFNVEDSSGMTALK